MLQRFSIRIAQIDRIHVNRTVYPQFLRDVMLNVINHVVTEHHIDRCVNFHMQRCENLPRSVIMYCKVVNSDHPVVTVCNGFNITHHFGIRSLSQQRTYRLFYKGDPRPHYEQRHQNTHVPVNLHIKNMTDY